VYSTEIHFQANVKLQGNTVATVQTAFADARHTWLPVPDNRKLKLRMIIEIYAISFFIGLFLGLQCMRRERCVLTDGVQMAALSLIFD
jgi:hypothetical protein